MSDPAVEAAERAWKVSHLLHKDCRTVPPCCVATAREALAPIRELHQPIDISATLCPDECEIHEDECPLDVKVSVCRECFHVAEAADPYFWERPSSIDVVAWPCETAKRIYREDEL